MNAYAHQFYLWKWTKRQTTLSESPESKYDWGTFWGILILGYICISRRGRSQRLGWMRFLLLRAGLVRILIAGWREEQMSLPEDHLTEHTPSILVIPVLIQPGFQTAVICSVDLLDTVQIFSIYCCHVLFVLFLFELLPFS